AQPGCQRSTTDGSGTVCCQPGGRSNPILLPGFGGATKIGMPAAASWRATPSARRVSGSNVTTVLPGDGSVGDEKSPDSCLYEDQIEKLISECAQVTVRAITKIYAKYTPERRGPWCWSPLRAQGHAGAALGAHTPAVAPELFPTELNRRVGALGLTLDLVGKVLPELVVERVGQGSPRLVLENRQFVHDGVVGGLHG